MQSETTCSRFNTAAQDSNTGSLSREFGGLATAPLRHCATAPLRHCATAPLRHCVTAPLRHCTSVLLCHCATVPLRYYSHKCNIKVRMYAHIREHRHTHTYTHMHTQTYTHPYTHTHTHTQQFQQKEHLITIPNEKPMLRKMWIMVLYVSILD